MKILKWTKLNTTQQQKQKQLPQMRNNGVLLCSIIKHNNRPVSFEDMGQK